MKSRRRKNSWFGSIYAIQYVYRYVGEYNFSFLPLKFIISIQSKLEHFAPQQLNLHTYRTYYFFIDE